MGSVMSVVLYLVLLVPVAWALCGALRRRWGRRRSRLRVRVYPGSAGHVAGLAEVDAGRSPQHEFWRFDEGSGVWVLRDEAAAPGGRPRVPRQRDGG